MTSKLTAQELQDLDALVAVVIQLEPAAHEDEYQDLDYRMAFIRQELLQSGDLHWAFRYIGSQILEKPSISDALYITQAYIAEGNSQQAMEWEKRFFDMVLSQFETDDPQIIFHQKYEYLCELARLAHNRGDYAQRESYLSLVRWDLSYPSNSCFRMIDILLDCDKIDLLREFIVHLAPLHLTLSTTFSGIPTLHNLLRRGFELEFWALAGVCVVKAPECKNSIHYFGIRHAVELHNLPLAFRILSTEEYGQNSLMTNLCEALIETRQEGSLKALLTDFSFQQRYGAASRMQAWVTYARAGWREDSDFIQEQAIMLSHASGNIDQNYRHSLPLIFAWINVWDSSIRITDLPEISGLEWSTLVEPAIVHQNISLLEMAYQLAGLQNNWHCMLLAEYYAQRWGYPNSLQEKYEAKLQQMSESDVKWNWNQIQTLHKFVSQKWCNWEAEMALFQFCREKGIQIPWYILHGSIGNFVENRQIREAIPFILQADLSYEKLTLISKCLYLYFETRRNSD